MAKWKLPEGRKPITTMDSADLVLRMHDKLAAGFSKGDRIAELEELVEACKADAREAEAYAAELEAKLAKVVELALEECPFRWGTPNYNISRGSVQKVMERLTPEARAWVIDNTPQGGEISTLLAAIATDAYHEEMGG